MAEATWRDYQVGLTAARDYFATWNCAGEVPAETATSVGAFYAVSVVTPRLRPARFCVDGAGSDCTARQNLMTVAHCLT